MSVLGKGGLWVLSGPCPAPPGGMITCSVVFEAQVYKSSHRVVITHLEPFSVVLVVPGPGSGYSRSGQGYRV